ncbi:hypothetical protein TBLA_0G00350 [Henningerozyma blattae CBS 6284]|uniref:Uncharacterized protein n=1 Tax=Henningerozyma blattae (strain ATCC 34711 / CBS 6284 / DSM 70876 / NBRC 10599 / NRRL Y-10934 / UCD 77-7) TaxID=1071380 RepID=I2H6I2_HENB6|nr:hypothetical protein TBLA_0G00350 [Tetrapisispora blattae CBS 6284]CCH61984.1 hypothetical protein TBLA_0G00350 [Tetrapisispora blattae CBS 6284]
MGFFDAYFSKPDHSVNIMANSNDNLNDAKNKKRKTAKFISNQIKLYFLQIYNKMVLSFKDPMVVLGLIKYFMAFFIAFILCIIHPAGRWIGHDFRIFLPLATILHHPARSVGFQLEITIQSLLGGVLACGWSSFAWYISICTNPVAHHQGGILFASLFIALFIVTWLRAYFQRFMYFTLTAAIGFIYLHTVSLTFTKGATSLHWMFFWDFGISYIFGLLVSLLICIAVFPNFGNNEIIDNFISTNRDLRDLFLNSIDKHNTTDFTLNINPLIEMFNINLSNSYRDLTTQFTVTKFNLKILTNLRNSMTKLIALIRILPIKNYLLDQAELISLYENLFETKSKNNSASSTNMNTSEETSSLELKDINDTSDLEQFNSHLLNILKDTFSINVFKMIIELIRSTEIIEDTLLFFKFNYFPTKNNSKKNLSKLELNKKIKRSKYLLQKKLIALDTSYKKFSILIYNLQSKKRHTDPNFSRKNISNNFDDKIITSLLFIKTIRSICKAMILILDDSIELIDISNHNLNSKFNFHFNIPQYPLDRAIHRLPLQSLIDSGQGNTNNYIETKNSIDDIFEKLYNIYTSRHTYSNLNSNNKDSQNINSEEDNNLIFIRAMDHNDFNLHTTKNPIRYKLWKLTKLFSGNDFKWSVKIITIVTFISLPSWLKMSYHWYQTYQCWWGVILFYILCYKNYYTTKMFIFKRLAFGIIGMFWGWCSLQARHFGNPYVMMVMSSIFVVPMSINHLIFYNSNSSYTSLICYLIVALQPYSKLHHPSQHEVLTTASIWKYTWVISICLIIGITLSLVVNMVMWSFSASEELRLSTSSFISHLSQLYQSVASRYLYRDSGDDPTELTISLSHIWEVRLTQSLFELRKLFQNAKDELRFIPDFNYIAYDELLSICEVLLQEIIEARIAGTYFEIWENDNNLITIRALLSLRRDSVSSIITNFYIISNCFRSTNKLPRYMPNSILARKRLYDFIDKFEKENDNNPESTEKYYSTKSSSSKNAPTFNTGMFNNNEKDDNESTPSESNVETTQCGSDNQFSSSIDNNLTTQKTDNNIISNSTSGLNKIDSTSSIQDYELENWTEIHKLEFSKTFTNISKSVYLLIKASKDILGEESY